MNITRINIDKKDKYFLVCTIGYIILFLGVTFNYVAVRSNSCLMPVLSECKFKTDTHIGFNINNKPNYWLLTDVFKIGDRIYSIGDFFLYAGGLILFLNYFFYLKYIFKHNKKSVLWESKK